MSSQPRKSARTHRTTKAERAAFKPYRPPLPSKAARHQAALHRVTGTSTTDLQYNHDGKLSPAQRKKYRRMVRRRFSSYLWSTMTLLFWYLFLLTVPYMPVHWGIMPEALYVLYLLPLHLVGVLHFVTYSWQYDEPIDILRLFYRSIRRGPVYNVYLSKDAFQGTGLSSRYVRLGRFFRIQASEIRPHPGSTGFGKLRMAYLQGNWLIMPVVLVNAMSPGAIYRIHYMHFGRDVMVPVSVEYIGMFNKVTF